MSGALWTDLPVPADIDPKPPPKLSLSLSVAHAHAFSTPDGWEPSVDHRNSPPVADLTPPSPHSQNSADKPKWALSYRRYDTYDDLPYTVWEPVTSAVVDKTAPRSHHARAPSRPSSIPDPDDSSCNAASHTTPRAAEASSGTSISRAALVEARILAAAFTSKRTWEWASQAIPDPDYPNCAPPPSVGSSSRKQNTRTPTARRARDPDFEASKSNTDGFALSEIGVFGSVGTVGSVFGLKQPPCGLCRCDGFRIRYKIDGETCPLHIRSMTRGPTALSAKNRR